MSHGRYVDGRLGGHDAAVAVGDDDRRLVLRLEQPTDRRDVLGAIPAQRRPPRAGPSPQLGSAAAALWTYHYGTRDQFLREVLRRARQRQLKTFGRMLRPRPDEPYIETLARTWEEMTGPEGRPDAAAATG